MQQKVHSSTSVSSLFGTVVFSAVEYGVLCSCKHKSRRQVHFRKDRKVSGAFGHSLIFKKCGGKVFVFGQQFEVCSSSNHAPTALYGVNTGMLA